MITVLISDNDNREKIKEMLDEILKSTGNINVNIVKQADVIRIMKKEDIKSLVPLKDKIIELGDSLYQEKKGALYKSILEAIEKPLVEYILKRTEGNQLKAARILGINRNTLRAKIKKLGISVGQYKQ